MHKTVNLMNQVLVALIPALLVKSYYWGIGVWLGLVTCSLTALLVEIIACKITKRHWHAEIGNNAGLVTAFILCLSLPPNVPWFVYLVCTLVAIGMAKQVYGGLGQNIFNPAMVGVAVFLISYPQYLTNWAHIASSYNDWYQHWLLYLHADLSSVAASVDPSAVTAVDATAAQAAGDVVQAAGDVEPNSAAQVAEQANQVAQQVTEQAQEVAQEAQALNNTTPASLGVDGFTSATPLTEVKGLMHGKIDDTVLAAQAAALSKDFLAWGIYAGSFVLGGIYLIAKRIISWQLPLLSLAGFVVVSLLHYFVTGVPSANPLTALVLGSMLFGAFFIVTDPVTAPQYGIARIIYPLGVGALAYIIRAFTNYNDGVAFAVLFMNMLVPVLDIIFVPKEYGK